MLVMAPLLATGCDLPAGTAEQPGGDLDALTTMKLHAYDIGLIGLDLNGAKKEYQDQEIAKARPGGEFYLSAAKLEGWAADVERSVAMDGTLPTIDPAAKRFLAALRTLTARIQSLDSYYRMRTYLTDGLARGKREDPLVLADFDRALAAFVPFRNAVSEATDKADVAALGRMQAEGNMADYYTIALARQARALRPIAQEPDLVEDKVRMARADAIIGEVTQLLDKARAMQAKTAAIAAKAPKAASAVDSAEDSGPDRRLNDNVIPSAETMVGAYRTYQRSGGGPDRDREREQERLVDSTEGVILAVG